MIATYQIYENIISCNNEQVTVESLGGIYRFTFYKINNDEENLDYHIENEEHKDAEVYNVVGFSKVKNNFKDIWFYLPDTCNFYVDGSNVISENTQNNQSEKFLLISDEHQQSFYFNKDNNIYIVYYKISFTNLSSVTCEVTKKNLESFVKNINL